MNVNFYSTKDYENKPRLPAPGKQTQSNPISNAVKIFLNLPEILNQIERITSQLAKPTDIYGKIEYNTSLNCGIRLIKYTNGINEQIISSLHIRIKA